VKILRGVLLGSVIAWSGQALAAEDTSAEIRALQARLKQLEQRIENQGRREQA
jgi:gas vesicle protein